MWQQIAMAEEIVWEVGGRTITVTVEQRRAEGLRWVASAQVERWGATAYGASRGEVLRQLEHAVQAKLDPSGSPCG